jgi:dolichyl-phosphate beta-glucosyltransferase
MVSTVMVVPCYNEAGRLSPEAFRAFAKILALRRLPLRGRWQHGPHLRRHLEAQGYLATSFNILRLPSNIGKAEAVRQDFLQALQSEPIYVGFWDSDLATPLDAIPLFEAVFWDRLLTEVVLGARVKLLSRDVQRRPVRHYLGRVFATAVAVAVGLEVYDSQCGAKLFRVTGALRDALPLALDLRRRDPGPLPPAEAE